MTDAAHTPYLGLAPFLRASIAGVDLRPLAQQSLLAVQQGPTNAAHWMNLSTLLFSLDQREAAFACQREALALTRLFSIPPESGIRRRLLLICIAGDIAANTPLDCLLEGTDIELLYYFATLEAPLPDPCPPHDALFMACGYSTEHAPLLQRLVEHLAHWPVPVLNHPARLQRTERDQASACLANLPGVLMPRNLAVSRTALAEIAQGAISAQATFALDFPLIIRPLDSHAGRDLARLDTLAALSDYLAAHPQPDFFVAPFIDYRSADGQYRKFRIALVRGQAFAAHLAIRDHWMIHYLNAGMYENAAKRAEEAAFMAGFSDFAARHREALAAIAERMGLEYVCFDGAELPDGRLLIFEIDHVMVVHAMDPIDLFPYKPAAIQKIMEAFRQLLEPSAHIA
ncbi:RimK family alpha-L-glutamate ligase [Halothiobacillus sp. DCM-1]|uniref:ATP-grasp domain-containing protein n=1 Tax=Halothiobacillus sp. DCM-1 TaxID=3112558 RepID=UPI00324C4CD1